MKVVSREEIISRLRKIIDGYGSQKKAAKALGVSDAYISAVMTNRKPPSESLLALVGTQKLSVFVEL